MNIGAEIPFRRSRLVPSATGSLIFDHACADKARTMEKKQDSDMRIWSNGRFRKV